MTKKTAPANPHGKQFTRYVLLVRHASRERKWDQSEVEHSMTGWDESFFSDTPAPLASPPPEASPPAATSPPAAAIECGVPASSRKTGFAVTRDLAGQLCDQLQIDNQMIGGIFHSGHKVAAQTARLFGYVFEHRQRLDLTSPAGSAVEEWPELTPQDPQESTEGTVNRVKSSACSAVLVIGHQPQLTKIARRLAKLPAGVLPLGSSEIACIELGERPRLVWLMTEKPSDLLTELKAKIASKFDVAKFFLGALVVGTGLTLSDSVWNLTNRNAKLVAGMGAFAALVSLALTAATLFSYDRLLMPQDFWAATDQEDGARGRGPSWTVRRPPAQAQMILYYEMVHIWTHLFIPAIVSAFVAVGLIVAARAHNSLTVPPFASTPELIKLHPLLSLIGLAAIALAIGWLAYDRWKPRLGFDD